MIADDQELAASLERIRHLQNQVAYLRARWRPIRQITICQHPGSWRRSTECSWRCASTSLFTRAS